MPRIMLPEAQWREIQLACLGVNKHSRMPGFGACADGFKRNQRFNQAGSALRSSNAPPPPILPTLSLRLLDMEAESLATELEALFLLPVLAMVADLAMEDEADNAAAGGEEAGGDGFLAALGAAGFDDMCGGLADNKVRELAIFSFPFGRCSQRCVQQRFKISLGRKKQLPPLRVASRQNKSILSTNSQPWQRAAHRKTPPFVGLRSP